MGKYESFFNEIAVQLDLTESEFNTITNSYRAVGEYLAKDKILSQYNVEVFPQGSMRLGTVVKPLKKDDYDIDLVCEFTAKTANLMPNEVKHLVGDSLKASQYESQLQEEHGRCWTLDYQASPPYHIDILPGVEINKGRVKATIRNKKGVYEWLYTNPKGFADWFAGIYHKRIVFDETRNVEEVKRYENKTPLQRAVQLIKRHRDVCFRNHPDDGPASIIITALTGLSYGGETSIEEILRKNPLAWASYIKKVNGKYCIQIPGLPDDNYADKWNGEDPKAADSFFEWHAKLLLDLDNLFRQTEINGFLKVARELFDSSSVDQISNEKRRIVDSLSESFSREKKLPMALEDYHPLFRHAQRITSKYVYVPKTSVSIKIQARVYDSEGDAYDNKKPSAGFSNSSPLLNKGKWIRFTANVLGITNFKILWQITNTGKEANEDKDDGGLRGVFYPCEQNWKYTRIEHTAYAGTHFVQAFLIDQSGKGACIKKSNILTVNVGGSYD